MSMPATVQERERGPDGACPFLFVDVAIHWRGGFVSQHEVVRPVKSYEKLRDFDKLMDRIVVLRGEGRTSAQIAECLNREGFSPPKRCGVFSSPSSSANC